MSGSPGLSWSSPNSGVRENRPKEAAGIAGDKFTSVVAAGVGVVEAALCDETSLVDVAADLPRSLDSDLDRPSRRAIKERFRLCSGMARKI